MPSTQNKAVALTRNLKFYHDVFGCDPLNWTNVTPSWLEKSSLEELELSHCYVTDATIFSCMIHDVKLRDDKKLSINLAENPCLTNAGLRYLALLIGPDSNNSDVDINVSGCPRITEHGLQSLCMKLNVKNASINATGCNVSSLLQSELYSAVSKASVTVTTESDYLVAPDSASKIKRNGAKSLGRHTRVLVYSYEGAPSVASLVTGKSAAATSSTCPPRHVEATENNVTVHLAEAVLSGLGASVLLRGGADWVLVPFPADRDWAGIRKLILLPLCHFFCQNSIEYDTSWLPKFVFLAVSGNTDSTQDWKQKITEELKDFVKKPSDWIDEIKKICLEETMLPSFEDHLTISNILTSTQRIEAFSANLEDLVFCLPLVPSSQRELISLLSGSQAEKESILPHLQLNDGDPCAQTIMSLKGRRIVREEDVVALCKAEVPELSSARVVTRRLRMLHDLGLLLYLQDTDSRVVVTDIDWFVGLLCELGEGGSPLGKNVMPSLHADTLTRSQQEVMQIIAKHVKERDRKLVLELLLEYTEFVALLPERTAGPGPTFYLVKPSTLLPTPQQPEWDQYVAEVEECKGISTVSRDFVLMCDSRIAVWFSVLADVLRLYRPTLLYRGGVVCHYDAAEIVVSADLNDSQFSKIRVLVRSVSDPALDTQQEVLKYLNHVMAILSDVIMFALLKLGAPLRLDGNTSERYERHCLMECSGHVWDSPLLEVRDRKQKQDNRQKRPTICSLCGNCAHSGMYCECNSMHGDNYSHCFCNTSTTCCYKCGICKRCAHRLWRARSFLRPNLERVNSLEFEPRTELGKTYFDGTTFDQVEVCPSSLLCLSLVGDHHEVKMLELPEMDSSSTKNETWKLGELEVSKQDRFTLILSEPEEKEGGLSNERRFHFELCENVTLWPHGEVHYLGRSDVEPGVLVSEQPLTPTHNYFDIEIVKLSPGASLKIGVSDVYMEETVLLTIDAEDSYLAKNQGYIGFGVRFDDGRRKMFYSRQGEKPVSIYTPGKVSKRYEEMLRDRDVHACLTVRGEGETVIRLLPSAVWRHQPDYKIVKKPTDESLLELSSWTRIGTSTVQVGPSSEIIFFGSDPVSYFELHNLATSDNCYEYELQVHHKDISVTPERGEINGGDKILFQVQLDKGSEFPQYGYIGLTLKKPNSEQTEYCGLNIAKGSRTEVDTVDENLVWSRFSKTKRKARKICAELHLASFPGTSELVWQPQNEEEIGLLPASPETLQFQRSVGVRLELNGFVLFDGCMPYDRYHLKVSSPQHTITATDHKDRRVLIFQTGNPLQISLVKMPKAKLWPRQEVGDLVFAPLPTQNDSKISYWPVLINKITGNEASVEWISKSQLPSEVYSDRVHLENLHSMCCFSDFNEIRTVYNAESQTTYLSSWAYESGDEPPASQEVAEWDDTNKSKNVTVNGGSATRAYVAQSTDAVRLNKGLTTGTHLFKITIKSAGGFGSFAQVGVCTANAKMHLEAYGFVFGSDNQSWVWDLPSKSFWHHGSRKGNPKECTSDTIYMMLILDGTKRVKFRSRGDSTYEELQMSTNAPVYPAVATVYGGSEMIITRLQLREENPDNKHEKVTFHLPQNFDGERGYPAITSAELLSESGLSTTLPSNIKNYMRLTISLGKTSPCFRLRAASTVVHRSLQSLHEHAQRIESEGPVVVLPAQVTSSSLLYPTVQNWTATDVDLLVHALCFYPAVGSVMGAPSSLLQPVMHFRAESGHACTLDDLDTYLHLASQALLYFATNRVYLPDRLDELMKQVASLPRQLAENALQRVFRMFAAILFLFQTHLKDPKENMLVDKIPRGSEAYCHAHEWAMDMDKPLAYAEPYSSCLTALDINLVLPDNFQDLFPNLIFINWSSVLDETKILKMPVRISGLWRLQVLTLDGNVNRLPDDIGDCLRLSILRVNEASLTELPQSLGRARHLRLLTLTDVKLRSIPDRLQWPELEALTLQRTAVNDLPRDFGDLASLTELSLHGFVESNWEFLAPGTLDHAWVTKYSSLGLDWRKGDEDGGIPDCIFRLHNLTRLDLSYQLIRFVPKHICRLERLQSLELNTCVLLVDLPPVLGIMEPLHVIKMQSCPLLQSPPQNVAAQGTRAVKAYLRGLISGKTKIYRTKLMCVGLGGAGKTSLLKALMLPTLSTKGTKDVDITTGIDIKLWKSPNAAGQEITFSTWDFAGQDIYYNTHQFFLSGRAVYLLLWTCRLGYKHAGLDFWLNSIASHAPRSSVIIVGTHVDMVPVAEFPCEFYKEMFPQIKGFFKVSALTGENMGALKEAILDCASKEPYMGDVIPTTFLMLEQRILGLRTKKSVLQHSEAQQLAMEAGIFDDKEMNDALQCLHDLGTVQFFNVAALRQHIVINPQWIIDVMACVVSIKDTPIKEGVFNHARDKAMLWSKYSPALHDWLLNLTEAFMLTFPVSEGINLVPCLLPPEQPQIEWPSELADGISEAMVLYRFRYLPAGLFNRLQVRLSTYSDRSKIWKHGAVLRNYDHLALIVEDRKNELLVRVQGPRPQNITLLVHDVLETLIADFFVGVKFQYLLPCPSCVLAYSDKPDDLTMFDAGLIRRASMRKVHTLQCRSHFHNISLSRLEVCMPPESGHELELHLSQSLNALHRYRYSIQKEILIAVCAADLQEPLDSAAPHLRPQELIQDIQKWPWSCSVEKISRSSLSSITAEDAKLILMFISERFAGDPSCVEFFRHVSNDLNKVWQVVCIGQSKNWLKANTLGAVIGPSHVFIDMTKKMRPGDQLYGNHLDSLKAAVTMHFNKLDNTNSRAPADCFISYCWANSYDEARLRGVDTASKTLGDGWQSDPRQIKNFLEKNDIKCWMDKSSVPAGELFGEIIDGINKAKVVLVCMSAEYNLSKNCMMELRFAEVTVGKPIVGVMVGKGKDYIETEMEGLLVRSDAPVFDLRHTNEKELKELLNKLREIIAKAPNVEEAVVSVASEELNSRYFQEEIELIQLKLMRFMRDVRSQEIVRFPNFIVIDFLNSLSKESQVKVSESRPPSASRPKSGLRRRLTKEMAPHGLVEEGTHWPEEPIGIKVFCEYERGCHVMQGHVRLTENAADKVKIVRDSSLYLLRILSFLQHNGATLNVNSHPRGQEFKAFLEKCTEDPQSADFKTSYVNLLKHVKEAEYDEDFLGLTRCSNTNGQIRWLCEQHMRQGKYIPATENMIGKIGGNRAWVGNLLELDGHDLMAEGLRSALEKLYASAPPRPPRLLQHLDLPARINAQLRLWHNALSTADQGGNDLETETPQQQQQQQQGEPSPQVRSPAHGAKSSLQKRQTLLGDGQRALTPRTRTRMAASVLALSGGSSTSGFRETNAEGGSEAKNDNGAEKNGTKSRACVVM